MQAHNDNTFDVFAVAAFNTKPIKRTLKQGATLKDLLGAYNEQIVLYDNVVIMVGGEIVPPDYWHRVKPKAGTVVNVCVRPAGGGGRKSPLATVLGIVVTLAAPGIGNALAIGALNAGVGLTAAQGIFLGKALGFAVGAVGKLLVSAIAPPPKPKAAARANVNNAAESPTLFIEGASNQLDRTGVVPVNLGTNRVYPKQAALPYTETVNNEQFVRQLFTYGYGDQVEIEDIRIGETSITEYEGVTLEHKLAADLKNGTSLYSNDVFQDGFNVLLSQPDGYTTRTSQANADELIIDITFDRGLAEFNAQGQRLAREVVLDAQYAPTGTSNWSSGFESYKSYAAQTISINAIQGYDGFGRSRYRKDLIVLDTASGVGSVVGGTHIGFNVNSLIAPPTPHGKTPIATVIIEQRVGIAPSVTYHYTIIDNRDPALFGNVIEDSGDFVASENTGFNPPAIDLTAGGIKFKGLVINNSTTSAFRRTVRFNVPNGQYDVRVKRITADSASDQIFDTAYWTALKTVSYTAPVSADGVNGTAIRIKASEQLNGSIDQFNVLLSTLMPDYDSGTDTWVTRKTSNPASIYRYVLQGTPNAKPLTDSQIDLDALEEWHTHCETQGYTYDYYIDYEASVDDILRDVAAAGAASPAIVDGKRTVVVDKVKTDIVQIVTPRNSWGYKAELTYPELPHAFHVEFRNKDKGYRVDQRTVYDDGYNSGNATKFERLEYLSTTSSDLAFKHGRRHIASVRLRPESHIFFMDVEHLVATRGDRIKLVNDVPLIGVGHGRISAVTDDTTNVTSVTLDDVVQLSSSSTYYIRIRKANGDQLYKELSSASGEVSTVSFATPFPIAETPAVGDLCYVVETGKELDLIIAEIRPGPNLSAQIRAVDYAPEIFTAESTSIPAFQSNITLPFELRRPTVPQLLSIQSDESVMVRNSDGSWQTRMVINLQNNNEFDVSPSVRVRQSGADAFELAQVVASSANQVVITGLQDGFYYDLEIRYKNGSSNLVSPILPINNIKFEGAVATPDNVAGFISAISGDTIEFQWNPNSDIDLSHYKLKYSAAYSGAVWNTAQVLRDNITTNNLSLPFLGGTYMIKAVDVLGNESATETAIITYNPGNIRNVVQTITESTSFPGTKSNVRVDNATLRLEDTDSEGVYTFSGSTDLGAVFTSYVTASVTASGTFVNNIYDIPNIFEVDDIFGVGGGDIMAEPDILALEDVYGIDPADWSVELQIRTTQDDPTGSPTWTSWEELQAGFYQFWGAEYRLKLTSLADGISPSVSTLAVTIDMPDRIVSAEDITVEIAGKSISYATDHDGAFKDNPSVQITIQDGAVDDRIEFTSKTASGFTVKIYNATSAAYVQRLIDYTVAGYGKVE